ncbi:hypothetical protein, conserved [Plasmodium gonderi]|uniref:Uncharacterized protein n=1 Tax=Plasmodium gonderi TaxID=77519 RepID=A0A1Y1JNJ2_PLAGO|nr:hypothetical protein, conserved [Plasmodium gonderi]GAW81963.1 hypothetical protein, conserved [Plasmodium gonderi]
MDNSSIIASNENFQFQKPVIYKNRARSLIQQSNMIGSENQNKEQGNGTSIRDKIKRLFSSKHDQSIRDFQKTKLTMNKCLQKQEPNDTSINEFTPTHNQNIEWQPVYHESCKIKLPVDEYKTKISMPDEVLDEWVLNQNKISQHLLASKMNSTEKGCNDDYETSDDDSYIDGEGHHSDSKKSSSGNCIFNKSASKKSCMLNNEKEPYSKFKYYYNYYLVDEYLESLAESQNKNLEATGLDEHGQLYDNVSLNVKPIIVSKERLENGVPYDPSKLLK